MKKLFLLLLMGLFVACGPGGTAEGETAVSNDTDGAADTASEATAEVIAPAATPTRGPTIDVVHYPVAGTVAEAAQIRDTDWSKGAEEPLVSIIEYGDFQ